MPMWRSAGRPFGKSPISLWERVCCANTSRGQRFVPLDIDHDRVVRPGSQLDNFRDAVGAAGVGGFGQACLEAVFVHCIGDRMMVGGGPYLLGAAVRSTLCHP